MPTGASATAPTVPQQRNACRCIGSSAGSASAERRPQVPLGQRQQCLSNATPAGASAERRRQVPQQQRRAAPQQQRPQVPREQRRQWLSRATPACASAAAPAVAQQSNVAGASAAAPAAPQQSDAHMCLSSSTGSASAERRPLVPQQQRRQVPQQPCHIPWLHSTKRSDVAMPPSGRHRQGCTNKRLKCRGRPSMLHA
jgi:hypothetical protein